jgi:hypothetical protein
VTTEGKDPLMSRYKTLRTWSLVLIVLGVVSVISASFGVIAWAVQVDGFWDTMAVLLFGGPIAILLALWPIALGQAMRALADIGDSVTFDALTPTEARF